MTVRENSRLDHWYHQLTFFFYLVISMIGVGRKGKFIAGETKDTEKTIKLLRGSSIFVALFLCLDYLNFKPFF